MHRLIRSEDQHKLIELINEFKKDYDNTDIHYLSNFKDGFNEFYDSARMNSFWSNGKLFIIDLDTIMNIPEEKRTKFIELNAYTPHDFIMIYRDELPKGIISALKVNSEYVRLQPVLDEEIIKYAQKKVTQMGISFTSESFTFFTEYIYLNKFSVDNELFKLHTTYGDKLITSDDVKNVCFEYSNTKEYEIVDAYLAQAHTRALKLLLDVDRRIDPKRFISMLANRLTMLDKILRLSKNGYDESRISSELNIHPYRAKMLKIQAESIDRKFVMKTRLNMLIAIELLDEGRDLPDNVVRLLVAGYDLEHKMDKDTVLQAR